MAIKTIEQLKKFFRKGLYPTENNFADVLDSFRHKGSKVPLADVNGLPDALNRKCDTIVVDNINKTQAQINKDVDRLISMQEQQGENIDELRETDEEHQKSISRINETVREQDGKIETIQTQLAGKAPIGENGKVPSQYLPEALDDVLEFDSIDENSSASVKMSTYTGTIGRVVYLSKYNRFACVAQGVYYDNWSGADPFGFIDNNGRIPMSGKLYVDKSTNKTYRWSGSTIVCTGNPIAVGYTEGTAYPGNAGTQLSQDVQTATQKATEAKTAADTAKTTASAAQTTANTAKTNADSALTKATEAKTAAEDAVLATEFILFNGVWNNIVNGIKLQTAGGSPQIFFLPEEKVFVASLGGFDFADNWDGAVRYGIPQRNGGRTPYPNRIYVDTSTGLTYRWEKNCLVPLTFSHSLSCQSRDRNLYLFGHQKYLDAGLVPYIFRLTRKRNFYDGPHPYHSETRRGWNVMGNSEVISIDRESGLVSFSTTEHRYWCSPGQRKHNNFNTEAVNLVTINCDKNGFLKVSWGDKSVHMIKSKHRLTGEGQPWRRLSLPFGIAFGPRNSNPGKLMTLSDMASPLATFTLRNFNDEWNFGK